MKAYSSVEKIWILGHKDKFLGLFLLENVNSQIILCINITLQSMIDLFEDWSVSK